MITRIDSKNLGSHEASKNSLALPRMLSRPCHSACLVESDHQNRHVEMSEAIRGREVAATVDPKFNESDQNDAHSDGSVTIRVAIGKVLRFPVSFLNSFGN